MEEEGEESIKIIIKRGKIIIKIIKRGKREKREKIMIKREFFFFF